MFFLNIFDVSLLPKEHHQNYWKFLQVNNICLKTDTILLQCTFYQFQYFIITCQHKEIYQRRSQSKSFNGNDLMVGWSRLINKLSLIRILNLFASEARISKWPKSIEQLHSSRWSDSANCFAHLDAF